MLAVTFDEGLGPKRQSHIYSLVQELFLCHSISWGLYQIEMLTLVQARREPRRAPGKLLPNGPLLGKTVYVITNFISAVFSSSNDCVILRQKFPQASD